MSRATIIAGGGGHEREVTVSFDRYGHGAPLDKTEGHIPRTLEALFRAALPESWKIENRGSRLEVHPSGRFAGGYCEDDVRAIELAVADLGFESETR